MTDSSRSLSDVVSCLSDYDPDALSVADAQRIIADFITPLQVGEKIALRSALGRVLASDIVSTINVPNHDNSAMDGYALRGGDLTDGPLTLQVIGTALAGRAFEGSIGSGQCIRIMTGAIMPPGCDTVIPQEFTIDRKSV